jgi:hypothetical protein
VITYVFSVFNRTPMSRVRDCCCSAENSEISGGRQVFGLRQRFDHFEHGGPVQTASTLQEESPPIKATHWRAISHLETTCKRFNINKEENLLISGTREKSAVADSAEPKQQAVLQRLRLLFLLRQHFHGCQYFTRR